MLTFIDFLSHLLMFVKFYDAGQVLAFISFVMFPLLLGGQVMVKSKLQDLLRTFFKKM